MTTKEKIIAISELVPKISYFDFDGFDEDDEDYEQVEFSTRENGNMGNDTAGEADFKEAVRVAERIKEIYPDVNYNISDYDEWVFLKFDFNKE